MCCQYAMWRSTLSVDALWRVTCHAILSHCAIIPRFIRRLEWLERLVGGLYIVQPSCKGSSSISIMEVSVRQGRAGPQCTHSCQSTVVTIAYEVVLSFPYRTQTATHPTRSQKDSCESKPSSATTHGEMKSRDIAKRQSATSVQGLGLIRVEK